MIFGILMVISVTMLWVLVIICVYDITKIERRLKKEKK